VTPIGGGETDEAAAAESYVKGSREEVAGWRSIYPKAIGEQPGCLRVLPTPKQPRHKTNSYTEPRGLSDQPNMAKVASHKRKSFSLFLSHFKQECGTEARLVQGLLQPMLESDNNHVFLDSDELQDLRHLLDHVKASRVVVLLQSKSVLTRPWVILEIYTAITHGVPIVALNVQNTYPYSYGKALGFLMHFDEEIEKCPGAAQLLLGCGVDPQDVAWRLSSVIPNIISTDFDPNAR
jgi:hypothetical protein